MVTVSMDISLAIIAQVSVVQICVRVNQNISKGATWAHIYLYHGADLQIPACVLYRMRFIENTFYIHREHILWSGVDLQIPACASASIYIYVCPRP